MEDCRAARRNRSNSYCTSLCGSVGRCNVDLVAVTDGHLESDICGKKTAQPLCRKSTKLETPLVEEHGGRLEWSSAWRSFHALLQ